MPETVTLWPHLLEYVTVLLGRFEAGPHCSVVVRGCECAHEEGDLAG